MCHISVNNLPGVVLEASFISGIHCVAGMWRCLKNTALMQCNLRKMLSSLKLCMLTQKTTLNVHLKMALTRTTSYSLTIHLNISCAVLPECSIVITVTVFTGVIECCLLMDSVVASVSTPVAGPLEDQALTSVAGPREGHDMTSTNGPLDGEAVTPVARPLEGCRCTTCSQEMLGKHEEIQLSDLLRYWQAWGASICICSPRPCWFTVKSLSCEILLGFYR